MRRDVGSILTLGLGLSCINLRFYNLGPLDLAIVAGQVQSWSTILAVGFSSVANGRCIELVVETLNIWTDFFNMVSGVRVVEWLKDRSNVLSCCQIRPTNCRRGLRKLTAGGWTPEDSGDNRVPSKKPANGCQ